MKLCSLNAQFAATVDDFSDLSAGPHDGCYDIQSVRSSLCYSVFQPRQASPEQKMPSHSKAGGITVATQASDGVDITIARS